MVKEVQPAERVKKAIQLPPSITVKRMGEVINVSPLDIIKQLMRNGVMASINQVIDFDTAAVVAADMGFEATLVAPAPPAAAGKEAKKGLRPTPAGEGLVVRPPVVTIMGHVDHGKTSLLDAIRQTNVTATEAGGITQHIGAYQVDVDGRKVTFLDTPGHEAFTAMRARGAQVTDIAVVVVAADDGIQPQTVEAIDHARAAGVPIVVAINKIDKPAANPDVVKKQLADHGLVIEEWGGDVVCVPVSAKKRIGITELLDNILVVAEVAELKANPQQPAEGTVVEAELDKTRGPMATALVQNGTLYMGDVVVVGNTWGKVKAMFSDKGKRLKQAEPSTPVAVLGLNAVPQAGDILAAVGTEQEARAIVERRQAERQARTQTAKKAISLDDLFVQVSQGNVKDLNIVLKTDVQGSIEPIKNSLERLSTEQVRVRVIHSGTGSLTESDVLLAMASKGIIIGFNSRPEPGAKRLAETEGVDIRTYDIIYNLVDDVQKALKGMLEPIIREVVEGRGKLIAVFPHGKGKIAGVLVSEGKINRSAKVRIVRQGKVVAEATIASMKRFKDNVAEVAAGLETGIVLEGYNDFQIDDILEAYRKERSS